ncbi:MAG: cyclase family protein [Kiritimatiellae bacterium]|nr:cyclase family protein [Kiritimatiellia bacterium]
MFFDLSILVPASVREKALTNERMAALGHLGTHFDVMNKQFPLQNLERPGLVFDVSGITDRDIDLEDIDLSLIQKDMFVAFCTGFIEQVGYGNDNYFTAHPQLSNRLIDGLLDRHIAIIGIDFAGVRRGQEHTPKDQYCADKGVFIVENLCNLKSLLDGQKQCRFTAHTYPIKLADMTGLPCRVVGEK